MLTTDVKESVPEAAKLLADSRVTHYWDDKKELVGAYKSIIPTREEESGEYVDAWDVYLLFRYDAEWKRWPPAPSYWMHQLKLDPNRKLNGDILSLEVKNFLNGGRVLRP